MSRPVSLVSFTKCVRSATLSVLPQKQLTAESASERRSAIEAVTARLNISHSRYQKSLSPDSHGSVINSDTEAGMVVSYTITRLLRGLSATEESTRLLSAEALKEILKQCSWISIDDYFTLMDRLLNKESGSLSVFRESQLLILTFSGLLFIATDRIYQCNSDQLTYLFTNITRGRQSGGMVDVSVQVLIALLDVIDPPKKSDETPFVLAEWLNEQHSESSPSAKPSRFTQSGITGNTELIRKLWGLLTKLLPQRLTDITMLSAMQLRGLLRVCDACRRLDIRTAANSESKSTSDAAMVHEMVHHTLQGGQIADDLLSLLINTLKSDARSSLKSVQRGKTTLGEEQAKLGGSVFRDCVIWRMAFQLFVLNSSPLKTPKPKKGKKIKSEESKQDTAQECGSDAILQSRCSLLAKRLSKLLSKLMNEVTGDIGLVIAVELTQFSFLHLKQRDESAMRTLLMDSLISERVLKFGGRKFQRSNLESISTLINIIRDLSVIRDVFGDSIYNRIQLFCPDLTITLKKKSEDTQHLSLAAKELLMREQIAQFWRANDKVYASRECVNRKQWDSVIDRSEYKRLLNLMPKSLQMISSMVCDSLMLFKNDKSVTKRSMKETRQLFQCAVEFLIRVVALSNPTGDICNWYRFESILNTARKELRKVIRTAWQQMIHQHTSDLCKFYDTCNVHSILEKLQSSSDSGSSELSIRYPSMLDDQIDECTRLTRKLDGTLKKLSHLKSERNDCNYGRKVLECVFGLMRLYIHVDDELALDESISAIHEGLSSLKKNNENIDELGAKLAEFVNETLKMEDPTLILCSRELFFTFAAHFGTESMSPILKLLSSTSKVITEPEAEEDEIDLMDEDLASDSDSDSKSESDGESISGDEDDFEMVDYADKKHYGINDSSSDESSFEDDSSSDAASETTEKTKKRKLNEMHETDDLSVMEYDSSTVKKQRKVEQESKEDVTMEFETEFDQMDRALSKVFRQKRKFSKKGQFSAKMHLRKALYLFLDKFANRFPAHPLIVTFLPILMEQLWYSFTLFKYAENKKRAKETKEALKKEDGKPAQHSRLSATALEALEQTVASMYDHFGVPEWRKNPKMKSQWREILLFKGKSKNKIPAHFEQSYTVIESIVSQQTSRFVRSDINEQKYGGSSIQIEWLRPLMEDVISLNQRAPTFEHELVGIRVLNFVARIYLLICVRDMSEEDLSRFVNETELAVPSKITSNVVCGQHESQSELTWLMNVYFGNLLCLMKQPHRLWYFSRDYFDVFVQSNDLFGWKLMIEAMKHFEECKNGWSHQQLYQVLQSALTRANFPLHRQCVLKLSEIILEPFKQTMSETNSRIHCRIAKSYATKCVGLLLRRMHKVGLDDHPSKKALESAINEALKRKESIQSKKKKLWTKGVKQRDRALKKKRKKRPDWQKRKKQSGKQK